LKAEYEKLAKLHDAFNDTHSKYVQPLIEQGKLQSLLNFSDALKQFDEDY
jgi:hypothetical protein